MGFQTELVDTNWQRKRVKMLEETKKQEKEVKEMFQRQSKPGTQKKATPPLPKLTSVLRSTCYLLIIWCTCGYKTITHFFLFNSILTQRLPARVGTTRIKAALLNSVI